MIKFDFDYYKPDTCKEAYELICELKGANLNAVYYAGGTELLSNFRNGKMTVDAVIDLKSIASLVGIEETDEFYIIGSATPLNTIIEYPGLESISLAIGQMHVQCL